MRVRAAVLIVAGILVYASGLTTPFMFDDQNSVVDNASIRRLSPLSGPLSPPPDTPVAARPLANLTLAFNYAIHGTDVVGYHVVNLAIHLLAALLVFAVVRRTLKRVGEGRREEGRPPASAKATARPRSDVDARKDRSLRTKKGRSSGGSEDPPLRTEVIRSDVHPFAAAVARDATTVAFACALIWVVHPLTSEVVEYVSQRTESLMAVFYLLTLYCAIRAVESRGQRWTTGAVVACAAGMACKESMVTAPLVVALWDWCFLGGPLGGSAAFAKADPPYVRRRGLYLGLAATWVFLAILITSGGRTSAGFGAAAATSNGVAISPWVYLLNQAQMVARYFRLAFWPSGLVLDYGLPRALTIGDVLVPGALVIALVIATAIALIRVRKIGFAAAWVFITLAPTSSIVPIATEVGAERRMYLPLVGIVCLVVIGVYWIAWRAAAERLRGYATTAVAVVVAILAGAVTYARTQEYRSRLTIARTMVERWPSGRGHFVLAYELMQAGQEEAAIEELRRARDGYLPAHYGLGVELASVGRYDEAVTELREFIRVMPASPAVVPARELLGRLLIDRGQIAAAAEQFNLILQAVPNHQRARQYLAAIGARPPRN